MKVGAIVQARMGSSRLPGKVLLRAAGKTLLEHLVERLGSCRSFGRPIVATSRQGQDDPIADLCRAAGIPCFRGSESDVLDRYYRAALEFGLDVIVRVTSDCPLVDPGLTDAMVRFYLEHRTEYDLVTNRHPLTFPDGLDVDVLSIGGLAHAWAHAARPHQREHVIPYCWEGAMRVANLEDPERGFLRHRWTVDYPEDYPLVKAVLEALYTPGRPFAAADVLDFLSRNPTVSALNAKYLPTSCSLGPAGPGPATYARFVVRWGDGLPWVFTPTPEREPRGLGPAPHTDEATPPPQPEGGAPA